MPSGRVDMLKKQKEMRERNGFDLRDRSDLPINRMEKDRVMVRMIKDGKASDPGLKREADAIQREHERNRKAQMQGKDQRELRELRIRAGMRPN